MHISYKMCPLVAQIEKYSDSALQEKVRNSCGNRAVNKRIYEKSLDGAETISFGGARCG